MGRFAPAGERTSHERPETVIKNPWRRERIREGLSRHSVLESDVHVLVGMHTEFIHLPVNYANQSLLLIAPSLRSANGFFGRTEDVLPIFDPIGMLIVPGEDDIGP